MITISDVKKLATDKVFYRGKEYYEYNHVLEIQTRKNKLFAEVEGSDIHPYSVEIHFTKSGKIQEVGCDCPYDLEGICKHAVAVLLCYIEDSTKPISTSKKKSSNKSAKVKVKEIIENEQKQTLKLQTLVKMSKQELVDLVISLSEEKPELVTWMQNKINSTQDKKNYLQGKSKNATHFDLL